MHRLDKQNSITKFYNCKALLLNTKIKTFKDFQIYYTKLLRYSSTKTLHLYIFTLGFIFTQLGWNVYGRKVTFSIVLTFITFPYTIKHYTGIYISVHNTIKWIQWEQKRWLFKAFQSYRLLRARRALSIFKDFPLRTRRVLSLYNVYGHLAPFWFSTEHLWTVIAPFWLSTDDNVKWL